MNTNLVVTPRPEERLAAMWAAANPEQFAEAKGADEFRPIVRESKPRAFHAGGEGERADGKEDKRPRAASPIAAAEVGGIGWRDRRMERRLASWSVRQGRP